MSEGIGIVGFLVLVGLVVVIAIGFDKRATNPNSTTASFDREEEPTEPMPATRMLKTVDRKADTSPSPRVTGITPGATGRRSGHQRGTQMNSHRSDENPVLALHGSARDPLGGGSVHFGYGESYDSGDGGD